MGKTKPELTQPASTPDERVDRKAIAALVSMVLGWQWLDERFSVEARRWLPSLLVGLYLADKEGRGLTMRQACDLMGVDFAKTGPRYVRLAEKKGLIAIRERPPEDRRTTLLAPTDELRHFVDAHLDRLREWIVRTVKGGLRSQERHGVSTEKEPHAKSGSKDADVVRLPHDVRPYARRAAELVEAFLWSREIRPLLLDNIAPSLLQSAQFADGAARIAVLGGPWGIAQERLPTPAASSELARALFFPNVNSIKIFPGTHHFGFDAQVHPDDLQAAQAVTAIAQGLFAPQRTEDVRGLFSAGDFDGTLLLLGGSMSNALTRLVLEYTYANAQPSLMRARDPLVPLRYLYDTDHRRRPLTIAVDDHEPDWSVLDIMTGEPFNVEVDEQQRLLTDYLVVTVLPNFLSSVSFLRGEKIVIFGGLHGVGTRAAALLLQDPELLAHLRSSTENAEAWQALIVVDRISHSSRKRPVPTSLARSPRTSRLRIPEDAVQRFRFGADQAALDARNESAIGEHPRSS